MHLRRCALPLAAMVLVSAFFGTTVFAGSEQSPITVIAEFTDAGTIVSGNVVRVDGVEAGKVRQMILHDNKARLALSIGGKFTPLYANARVRIRPAMLLGELFVDLDRGTPDAPRLRDGDVIPASQTGRATDVQDVLDMVDQPTGTALSALLTGLGEGLAGHGDEAAATLAALAPALGRTEAVLQILRDQRQVLRAIIDKAEPVATALAADRGQQLDALVGAAGQALASVTAAQAGLDGGLRRLPGSLDTVQTALRQVSGLAGEATPLLNSLQPLTGDLPRVVSELRSFAGAARPALGALTPVLDRAHGLLGAAAPVAAELAPVSGDLARVGASSKTIVEALPVDLGKLLTAVRDLALTTAGGDGIAHYARGFIVYRPEAVKGALMSPPRTTTPAPATFGPPAPGAPPPPSPLGPAVGSVPPDPGSITGLTVVQERALLRYLLGG